MKSLVLGLFTLSLVALVGCKVTHKGSMKDAKASSSAASEKVICSLKGENRDIEVHPANGGCEVVYTKAKMPTTVASAKNSTSHCSDVVQRMKSKLETAGWTCK